MKHTLVKELPNNRAFFLFDAVRIHSELIQVDYDLVIPLNEVDCRGTFDHKKIKGKRLKTHNMIWLDRANNRHIPLGRTNIGGRNPSYPFNVFDNGIDLPFRDGAHVQWDNEKFGKKLEVYYRIEGRLYLLEYQDKEKQNGE